MLDLEGHTVTRQLGVQAVADFHKPLGPILVVAGDRDHATRASASISTRYSSPMRPDWIIVFAGRM